jgi:hypothetical protein
MRGSKGRFCLRVAVCFLLISFSVMAGVAHAIRLDLGAASGSPGSDVTIPITLNYEGANPNISAASIDIGYSTTLLENPRATIGPAGSAAGKDVASSTPSSGIFRVAILGFNQNVIQAGIVASVTFRIKEGATSGDTTLTNTASATDPSAKSVVVQGGSGTLTITSTITAPTPSSPSGGQVITTLTPQLTWSGGSNFSSLQINVSKSPFGAANIIYTSSWLSAGTTSITLPSGTLVAGTDYRWDVTACSGANGSGSCVTSNNATFSTQAAVTAGQKWSGPVSFSLKVTDLYEDTSGNVSFRNRTDIFTGTIVLYMEEEGLVPDEEGCYFSLISDDGNSAHCFWDIASIFTTLIKVGAADTFYLKGTGGFYMTNEGEEIDGIAYLDVSKGTLKKDKTGEVTSIIVSGTIAGGCESALVFSGKFTATLLKE